MAEDSLSSLENIVEVFNNEFLEIKGSTHNLLAKLRYTWTINNFNFSIYSVGDKSVSPTFSVEINNNKSEWHLILYPHDKKPDTIVKNNRYVVVNEIRCDLQLIDCNINEKLQVAYKICILNGKGGNTFSGSGSQQFKKGQCNTVLNEQYDSSIIEKSKFLFHDQLSIVCEIIYKSGSENNIQSLSALPNTPAIDFTFLFQNRQLSDITLCASGKEFPAHKVILSARSPVFRAMFQNDMEESRNNRVEITDIDEEGLGEMLRYMYTGEINELEEMAPKLLSIAEKYQLDDLKIRCEAELLKCLSLENVVEFFILSDTFRATNLNIQVKKFIKTHSSVLGTIRPEFQTMIRTHPHLAELLMGWLLKQ